LGGLRRTFPVPQMLRALMDLAANLLLFGMIVCSIYRVGHRTEAQAVGCAWVRFIIALAFWVRVVEHAEPKPNGHVKDHFDDHAAL